MRPHNKSTLWDEYLEHYDKHKKYFNTKHKKAFCKRCIDKTVADLDRSPEARAKFGATGLMESWFDWKFRQAFEMVEAISGRSSNMQRHIRTCEHISPEDRKRIMENFESSQASRSSREPEAEGSKPHQVGTAPSPWPASAQYGFQATIANRPRATSNSDDDRTSASSIPSPGPPIRRPPERGPSNSPPRPVQKLSLQSILNDDSEPYSSSRGYTVRVSQRSILHNFDRPPIASQELAVERGRVEQLDHDIDELQRLRTSLDDQSSSYHGYHAIPSYETATIERMRQRLEELHQENENLRRRILSTENDNGELKAKLELAGEKLGRLEAAERESRRVAISSSSGSGSYTMATPRAHSVPALTPLAEPETLKRRKVGSDTSGFVAINR